MGIIFDDKQRLFHLHNSEISYIFTILKNKQLGHVYFGKKIRHHAHLSESIRLAARPYTACVFEGDMEFSLEYLLQEYPAYGTSDYRHPAYQVQGEDGNTITNLEYVEHSISPGKPTLKELPATYVEGVDEATTLTLTLFDGYLNLYVMLSYTIFETRSVITRSVRFENRGKRRLTLLRSLSMSLDLPDADFELLQLSGAWARERHVHTRALAPGSQSVESTRGASSAVQNPFIALKRPSADEFQGEVYGFSLVYSGSFLAQIEVNQYESARVSMGINPFDFTWLLEGGEDFQTPEVVMVYSDRGLNGMSQTYHELYRKRLARGRWRDAERPVLINNWEATYFDFTEEKILTLAREAQTLGIELLVLDDGWFGQRDDDSSSLGDWFVYEEKLPQGLKSLGDEIEKLGLKFGLWFEPEMISKKSDLFRRHPDWLLHVPNRHLSPSRNQFVLDYSRREVRDAVYDMLVEVLSNAPISYVKWDMNRNMTEIGSAALPPERQKETAHRYLLGLYDMLERITQRFPDILFESCAGGGGRFDPGMLYYMPQTWTSDDTDAIERLKVQYGTSMVYPLSSMGAHVSAAPNHQVGRMTPIESRANVAFFGAFGYELDLKELAQEEKNVIKEQVAFYKAHRVLLHQGNFYRLSNSFERNFTCWMVVSEDKRDAIVMYCKVLSTPNAKFSTITLRGLLPDLLYRIEENGVEVYGDELMYRGLPLPVEHVDGDFASYLWTLQAR